MHAGLVLPARMAPAHAHRDHNLHEVHSTVYSTIQCNTVQSKGQCTLIELSKKMEDARKGRCPTVFPLTSALLQQILHQQQQKGTQLSTTSNDSAGVVSTSGSAPQLQGATAINLTEMGRQTHHGQESCAAISVQVLNKNNNIVTASESPKYTYKVKVVNAAKKNVAIGRYLHSFTDKFESVNGLRFTVGAKKKFT